ncbi:IS1341-type transposase (TCE32) [Natrialba chahannaoensis JCM 10990]|uniref:IS1341-type transposase (TCE32) n=1 Tax=Natrialba chahannaoensis JCM 10990 TaxID=1227492 RepID=M0ALQ6_9EURY|nr:IS1341-type transposase (TCE32) [Natrialba chahannaoensis JCM 10990]
MKRTNQFVVRPQSEQDRKLLHELLDASASLWNEITYERRQQYFDGETVWDTEDYRKKYVGVLGSATAQQVIRKNKSAWKSFFAAKENGEDSNPPGYWGNEDDGRELRTYIRNDQYTLKMGDRSRLEIPVGQDLKKKYGLGYRERLRLEVAGDPKWEGNQGQLELYYDERSNQSRAFQPVTVDDSRLDSPLADESAALDIGVNNIVACTTTTGQQYLYEGRDLFERFRETTQRIVELQSKLDNQHRTSKRIDRLYRRRCFDSARRQPNRRPRDTLVGADEREVAQLLGVPPVHRETRRYCRGVRDLDRGSIGSLDIADVSELRFNRGHDPAPGYAHLPVRVRRSRGPRSERDVHETARIGSTADGTARVPQVGRPYMVGDTTLSPSQRGAHKPEYPRIGESRPRGGST